ncbi:TIGR02530 family flagellar biosynthesis protein [Brevibacillus laterosporus]|uniref:TIGR02530 family flagellar biosynthesis protein n=1 Tax=Brevibacillus laterosporus TaxID=1465 RepID=UPI0018CDDBB4|nr:TIGR02530 family flagellar biosynthesis protein [Brevibacillus laterosporus]MBG9788101.1 flagellar protein [Brevibacillus laterosporus]MED1789792.1 TIGR02530 family flagellar biosynthesis protein [Brevibacillus laterosporus]
MNHHIRVGSTYYPSRLSTPKQTGASQPTTKPFDQWLSDSLTTQQSSSPKALSFSQHAVQRMRESGIELQPEDMKRLESGFQKARDKGARESLILMDNVAYVVSISNHKVITAMDESRMKENVFTNIDSAVFV